MAAAHQTLLLPGLIVLAVLQLSSAEVIYVPTGSDITNCSMKCPHRDGVLQLYRECGGEETPLLELWCDTMWLRNRFKPRLHYNMTTGCWILGEAGKNDSCVYIVVYNELPNETTSRKTLPVTVLDPVSVSFPGGYVTIGIVFTVVVMTCIALLVKYRCCKKTETEDIEVHRRNRRSDQLLTDRSSWREEESPHHDPQNMGENKGEPKV